MTYEEAVIELEDILTSLREGHLAIDELEEKTAKAAELIDWCRNRLRGLETKMSQLDE